MNGNTARIRNFWGEIHRGNGAKEGFGGPTEKSWKQILILMVGFWMVLASVAEGQGSSPQEHSAQEHHAQEPMTLSQAKAGSLLLSTDQQGFYHPAAGVETDVWIQVTGMVSRTVLRQSFRNPSEEWREGVYVFPLPTSAAVDAMRLVVGDRIIEGEIKEKGQAKRIYERAKKAGKKASLVEQERPNMFTTSVANIGPGELVEVVIEYQEDLRYDSGLFRLRFPMVVNPRYIPSGSSTVNSADLDGHHSPLDPSLVENETGMIGTPVSWALPTDEVPDAHRISPPVVCESMVPGEIFNPVNLAVSLDAGVPLEFIQSWSHDLEVTPQDSGAFLIELKDGVVPADRDFALEWKPETGHEPTATAFVEHYEGVDYLLLMLMPPQQKSADTRVPKETIFIVDRSGSMGGVPMRQAKQALAEALDRLSPEDHFNIVLFSSTAEKVFESSVPADETWIQAAKRHLDGVNADGGTEMMSALKLALPEADDASGASVKSNLGLRQVIFMTDGSVGNEEALFGYIRNHLGRSRLFTVGIGSAPNGYFMKKAAEFGRGTYTFIEDPRAVSTKMNELFTKIEHPVLRDLTLHWSDPDVDAWPKRPGDLYTGEPLVLTARSEKGFEDLLLEGWAGRDPWDRHLVLEKGKTSQGLHKLWARKKVESLMDSLVEGADLDTVRAEVVELGLRHHLVTKYTSLVAVDKTPSRPGHEELKTKPAPVHRPAGTLPRGGTSWRFQALLGSLFLALAWVMRRDR